ncbi:inner membrane transporter RhtA [Amycolatopsis pretoriensis]|uniref:Inner membrane transporter RhtA n=1 Tax=Amycolatopsis pretoriensis TaxID=218821 RepID=A0A1H5Q4J6_9PSEU|nr:EamA family transporter [Amycolatopsis pretoriensis]SEF20321.1 inner membrane transporter RhtA [Amycolatopsis pretoriensis]
MTSEGRRRGAALMTGSGLSNQVGASVAALAFPQLGPAGVVAIRQWVAAVVLLATTRPRLRAFTAAQWRLVLALALVFGTMNLTLYSAVDRIGLGLAVTLEFLGPLAVALAGSRRRGDLLGALVAATAVVVLVRPRPSTDYLGIGLALLAAACWAAYILLNRAIGARIPGVEGSAAAAGVSGLAYVPVGVFAMIAHRPDLGAVLAAVTAGVLSSAVPMLADLLTLRRVPAPVFGTVMSVNPVLAALVGWVVLGQRLDALSWAAIAVIVTVNVAAVLSSSAPVPSSPSAAGPAAPPTSPGTPAPPAAAAASSSGSSCPPRRSAA